jgi:uncharacterized protein YecT (DUF1311 family)
MAFRALPMVALAILGFGAAGSAGAADKSPPDPAYAAYDQCMKTASDNAAYDDCGGVLVTAEEARLNEAWQRVYPKLAPESKKALLAEERLWLAFKNGSCDYYRSGDYGREGQTLGAPTCRADIIASRVDELNGLSQH